MYTTLVLENLNALHENANAVPSEYTLGEGQASTQTQVTPSVSVPLGNQVTRTLVDDDQPATIIENPNSFSMNSQLQWSQNWKVEPNNSPPGLWLVQNIYLYVLGMPSSFDLKSVDAKDSSISKDAIHVFSSNSSFLLDLTKDIYKVCSVKTTPCVRIVPKDQIPQSGSDSCISPEEVHDDKPLHNWVCLGQYGSFHSKYIENNETEVNMYAYQKGIILDLAILALSIVTPSTSK